MNVHVYQTLPISDSMLFRMKEREVELGMAAAMLKAVHPMSLEEYNALLTEREQNHKAPPSLIVDDDAFLAVASSDDFWGKDFLDALIIFYRSKKALFQFQKEISRPKK